MSYAKFDSNHFPVRWMRAEWHFYRIWITMKKKLSWNGPWAYTGAIADFYWIYSGFDIIIWTPSLLFSTNQIQLSKHAVHPTGLLYSMGWASPRAGYSIIYVKCAIRATNHTTNSSTSDFEPLNNTSIWSRHQKETSRYQITSINKRRITRSSFIV